MDLRERSANPNQHPWELSRADMMLRLLARNARATRYADAGSGDLYFARRLCALTDAPIYAVDVDYENRGVEAQLVICTDLDQVPSGSVDCAVLVDVLEHVDDDVGFLHAVGRILRPAGQSIMKAAVPVLIDLFRIRLRYGGRHAGADRRPHDSARA